MTDDPRPGFNALRDKMLWHLKVHANAKPENNAEGLTNMAFEALGCPGGTAVADEALKALIEASDGRWVGEFCIDGPGLMNLLRGASALAVPKAEEWQSIETAPKDGREFIAVWQRQGDVMHVVKWNVFHKFWQSKGEALLGFESNATAWIPLPAPPATNG